MKGLRLASLACLAWPVSLAQVEGAPNMDERVNSLVSLLAAPSTVQMREWQPSMKDDGRALLQRCLVATDPACKGLSVGQALVPSVTVTVGTAARYASDEAFELDESCQLQTVIVKANHAKQGTCLMGVVPPRLATIVSTVTTLIEGTDPPEYRYEASTVVIDLDSFNIFNFLNFYSTSGSSNAYRIRIEQMVPSGTEDQLPKCDASGLQACRVSRVRGTCMEEVDGECVKQLGKYYCSPTREETQWVCEHEQPAACLGDSCEVPELPEQPERSGQSHQSDFAQAMMMLEVARQAGNYIEFSDEARENLLIFRGTYSECRDKVAWGLADCCRGGNPSDTHNRAALANLGVGLAIRGVEAMGSPHVHDMLFTGSDLRRSLKGLGSGNTGLFSAFSPSFSLYGLEVGLANNAIVFGFDPTSFALAVALAVVANLLECDQSEQLLGLRVGNGLCYQTASWCSDRSWFGCKEERESYCCHNSRLAKVVASAAKRQLGLPTNDCRGLTQANLERIDFGAIDMSEVIEQFANPGTDTDELLRRYQVANAGRYTTVTASSP